MYKFRQLSTNFRQLSPIILPYVFSLGSGILLYAIYMLTPHNGNPTEPSFRVFCVLVLIYLILVFVTIRMLIVRLQKQSQLIAERERQLAEAEKETMRANLLRAVSHDLRTPLTGIIGNSLAYLENQNHLTGDEREDLIRSIYEDSTWLIHMVENLLSVTHLSNGCLALKKSEEPVEEVVSEALQKLQRRHPGCEIHVSIPEELILLKMDPLLIEQVTINLLENALYHSETNAPIDFTITNLPHQVSFTVRDYGIGIPKDRLEHLFDGKEYTANSADFKKGMGLGLVICRTIISAHNGSLTGRNHENGAEFTFTLPK